MITGPLLGASAVIVRDGRVLLGLRRGAHGAGTWGLPGGKVDAAEHPADTVTRELLEEAGMTATSVRPLPWTNDVFADDELHYVTLHHLVTAEGEPQVVEPDKLVEWRWFEWDALPEPLFASFAALVATGWQPK